MLLDNLRISRKLTVAFAAVVLTMAAMGGWTFHALGQLGQARAKTEEATQVIATLEQAKFYLARQENSYRGYLLSLDPYYIERIAKHRGNFQKRVAAAQDLVAGKPDETQVLHEVGAAADRWHTQVVEAGRRLAVDPGTHAQAVQMVGPKGSADALMAPAEDGIEALYDAYSKRKDALLAEQAKVTRTAYMTIAGCFALALMTAIGLGMLLTRAIAKPVTSLTEAMRQLAAGDFTAEVPAQGRRDEVGLMADAVSVFKDAGLEKLRLEGLTAEQRKAAEAERAQNEAAKAKAQAELAAVVAALGEGLERLSAGDLTHRIAVGFPAEYEKLKADFNGAIGQLEGAMSVVLGNVRAIRSGSSEMASAADDLSRRTEQQAANLEQTAAALEEITVTMKKSASGATACAEVAEAARGDAETSGSVVTEAVEAMSAIEASAREITNIIGVIDEIAFQTNLLALNAGVEAARAGDAGKGFAVVASEVRALAQRSADAAKEIKTLISTSSAQVGRGVQLVDQTGVFLGRIVERVAEIDGLVSEIAAGAQEQSRGIVEVNNAVNQMDQLTQQNAAMVEESTAASHALSHEADTLDRSVSRFQVSQVAETQGARAPAAASAPQRRTVTALKTVGAGGAARKPVAETDSWEEF